VKTGNVSSHERLNTEGPRPKKKDYSKDICWKPRRACNYNNNQAKLRKHGPENSALGQNQGSGRRRKETEGLLPLVMDETNLAHEKIGFAD
jgi:hypothetical protein